jgi:CubicO group peptidase (beta-lactamase class C family)
MAIMILKERGKLDYDDNIKKYIPELPYQGITIRHLLNHTSGMPDYITLFNRHWDPGKEEMSDMKIADNVDVVNMLAKHKPGVLFKPGEIWRYSNTGYVLLAVIVSRAAKEPFEKFLHNHIFKPLGMSRTLVYSAIRDDKMKDRVWGFRYNLLGKGYISNDFNYLNGVAGDGAVYSTTGDLFKWDQALYTEKLVSKSTLNTAFTPVRLNNGKTYNYGFGWSLGKTITGEKRVSHGGGWVGFITYICRDIESNNSIILLTNHTSRYLRAVGEVVEQILYNKPYTLPKISIAQVVAKDLINQGVDSAICLYRRLKKNESHKYSFHERELNSLGYQLIEMERLDEAIEIFKFNVEMYPKAWNPYDSLGEAYMMKGDKKLAIQNYKKSLMLNPKNNNAINNLKKLREEKPKR